jgi:hypothetical protein
VLSENGVQGSSAQGRGRQLGKEHRMPCSRWHSVHIPKLADTDTEEDAGQTRPTQLASFVALNFGVGACFVTASNTCGSPPAGAMDACVLIWSPAMEARGIRLR